MRNYLQPQTTGDVLRNTFAIYGKGFWAILLTFLLPVLPFQVWQAEAKAANNTPLYFLAFVAGIVGGLFAFGAIAITVSDICLGNKPGITRSYLLQKGVQHDSRETAGYQFPEHNLLGNTCRATICASSAF